MLTHRCYLATKTSRHPRSRIACSASIRLCRFRSTLVDDQPLRILFCGSDEFSITCLNALDVYSKSTSSNIASINVATKTDKRTGRGLKVVKSPPIKHAAEQLGLPVHQFDTFRGWHLPKESSSNTSYINMVIAVSFGLLVPPRILGACRFGGLNVHPSMLPDLKGSAPIEHAIINGYRRTGVTVQTLHPSKFDEGQILAQTPWPGIDIPNPDEITSPELKKLLAKVGSDLLVHSLRERLYLQEIGQTESQQRQELRQAPKLTPESRHINFSSMTSTHILRLDRALGSLWVVPFVPSDAKSAAPNARLLIGSGLRIADANELNCVSPDILDNIKTGIPFCVVPKTDSIELSTSPLLVRTADGEYLSIAEITVSGIKPGKSAAVASKAHLFKEVSTFSNKDTKVFEFANKPT